MKSNIATKVEFVLDVLLLLFFYFTFRFSEKLNNFFIADLETAQCCCSGRYCWMAHTSSCDGQRGLDVPVDAFRHICRYLTLPCLVVTAQGVCRAWARAVAQSDVWGTRLEAVVGATDHTIPTTPARYLLM